MTKVGDVFLKIRDEGWLLELETKGSEPPRAFVTNIEDNEEISLTLEEFRFIHDLFGKRIHKFTTHKDDTHGWSYPERMPK